VLRYPPTWIAAGVTAASVWFLLTWFSPPLWLALLMLLIALGALAGWVLTVSATGTIDHLRLIESLTGREDVVAVGRLEGELERLGAGQAVEQLRLLREKRDNLSLVLKQRMDAGELTYGRYAGSAQKVYEAAVEGLQEVAVALQSVSTIDVDYIDEQLAVLLSDDDDDVAGDVSASLAERKGMFEGQHQRVARLLAQNERSMTVIDRTATALADIPTGKRHTEDADRAIAELEQLAERAGMYFQ
jgi:hypothetical protein